MKKSTIKVAFHIDMVTETEKKDCNTVLREQPEEADRYNQCNLSFSHIITCLSTNSVMAVL